MISIYTLNKTNEIHGSGMKHENGCNTIRTVNSVSVELIENMELLHEKANIK